MAGVTISFLTGDNGILIKAQTAKEENNEKEALEIIKLKITNAQMQSYSENQKFPTLQYIADILYDDVDIQYISLESRTEEAVKSEITVPENASIFTKLNDYPYEFEINPSIQVESTKKTDISNGEDDKSDIQDGYIKPNGTKFIEENGEYDIAKFEKVNVNVPTYKKESALKINEKSNKIDVAEYQYVDTTDLYTEDETTGQGKYWASGTINAQKGVNSIYVGFVPSKIVFTKQSSGATLVYNSSKSTSKVYTCHSEGILELPFNSTVTTSSNIRTIGVTTTAYLTQDNWYWFAVK